MDKRTVLAVVLSVVILAVGWIIVPMFTPKPATQAPVTTTAPAQVPAPTQPQPAAAAPAAAQTAATGKVTPVAQAESANPSNMTVVRETDVYRMSFSRAGGDITSLQLKKYKNLDGTPVEMIFASANGQYPFSISFGDYQEPTTTVLFDLKETTDSNKLAFEFSRGFLSATGVPFLLKKTYTFYPAEYMMQLDVTVENSVNELPNLGSSQFAYTLGIGPQIGPRFTKLDGRTDFRNFVYYEGGKRKDLGSLSGKKNELPATPGITWLGIVGKYFALIAVPDATEYRYVFDGQKLKESFDRSSMYLERTPIKASKSQDVFKFYIGPKTRDALSRYNDGKKNALGVEGLRLDDVVTSPFLVGWLVPPLNWLLEFFYKVIPNYGIAIILLTLLTKLLFLPLTFKSSEGMARMQSLNPKIQEIRTRLKDKPDKMNQEIATLYKTEKVNPLSGCLPLLLQLPIFFALYSVLFDSFSLRGAGFIPAWIPDLSVPDTVIPFTLSWPAWTGLHILPFIMVATQFFFTKFTQTPDTSQQAGQMKIMTYAMPALMFFLMYETPSGLVLYWTVSNILSVFQQLYINSVNKKKKQLAAIAGADSTRRKLK